MPPSESMKTALIKNVIHDNQKEACPLFTRFFFDCRFGNEGYMIFTVTNLKNILMQQLKFLS